MFKNCVCCGTYSALDEYDRCKACLSVDEHLLLLVRDYVRRKRKVNIQEVCDEFSISEDRIQRWIATDRLGYLAPTYKCSVCGQDVLIGSICACRREAKEPPFVYHGSPRSLQKKRDRYWDEISIIRKHQRRDIWQARNR